MEMGRWALYKPGCDIWRLSEAIGMGVFGWPALIFTSSADECLLIRVIRLGQELYAPRAKPQVNPSLHFLTESQSIFTSYVEIATL